MQVTQVIPVNHGIKDNIYFTANMRRSPDGGLCAGYVMTNLGHQVSATATARLGMMRKFTERAYTAASDYGINAWGLSPYIDGGLWIMTQSGSKIRA